LYSTYSCCVCPRASSEACWQLCGALGAARVVKADLMSFSCLERPVGSCGISKTFAVSRVWIDWPDMCTAQGRAVRLPWCAVARTNSITHSRENAASISIVCFEMPFVLAGTNFTRWFAHDAAAQESLPCIFTHEVDCAPDPHASTDRCSLHQTTWPHVYVGVGAELVKARQ
jgi:hypothetical protein